MIFENNKGKCSTCEKEHISTVKNLIIGQKAILKLPEEIKKLGAKKIFILADKNTFAAAGQKIEEIFIKSKLEFSKYVFDIDVVPNETAVGSAIMHYDFSCDVIVAIGSGVINDIGKILSCVTKAPYIIVATAPSMDGYASATSSMERNGLKVSLPTRCADIIIGDTDILKNAPLKMIKAGLGDMVAKYIAICEWRIANLILGEYYCEDIAKLVRAALKKCTDNISGILNRDENAVEAVFEGLILSGLAMNFAGVSRPASGAEHYFSHLIDMRGLEFGSKTELHGIQCAWGTKIFIALYEEMKNIIPNKQKALDNIKMFKFNDYAEQMREFVGRGAESMILAETKAQKYCPKKHSERLEKIITNWDSILQIIDEELPSLSYIEELFKAIDMPKMFDEITEPDYLKKNIIFTKDIRDKYIFSRLVWDLGIENELEIKI